MLTVKPWKIESVLQLLLGVFGSITFSGILAGALGYRGDPGQIDYMMMLIGAISVHGVGLLWINWFIRDHQMTWGDVVCPNLRKLPRLILLGVIGGMIGFYVCSILGGWIARLFQHFTVEPEAQSTIIALQTSISLPWIACFGVITIVLAPVVEEIFFRGILYPMVRQLGHPRMAIWGTSILFAATHANFQAFIPLTLLAVGLTWLYEKTDSLLAPILMHSTFNAINYGLTLYRGAYSAGGL